MLICAELAPYIETRFGVKPQEQNREGRWAQSGQYLNGLGQTVTFGIRACPQPEVCRRGRRTLKGGGL